MTKDNSKTEAAILEAAEDEFMSKGFDGARTSTIAAAAGVTHAMLHYYFRTKQALFDRIVDDKFNLLAESMLDAFRPNGDGDVVKQVTNAVERHFDFVAANPRLPYFVVNEVMQDNGSIASFQRHISRIVGMMKTHFQDELNHAVEQGRICETDFLMLLGDIVSLNAFSVALSTSL